MPRGYRSIVLALVGWLILAAVPSPNQRGAAQQGGSSQNIQRSLESISAAQNEIAAATNTGEYQRPCEDGEDNNRSDLCAQWKAANAATNAARWAWWSLGIGFTSVVLLVWTLWETRQGSRRELRAYVNVTDAKVVLDTLDPSRIRAIVDFTNSGETPALNVKSGLFIAVSAGNSLDKMPIVEHSLSGDASSTVMGKGVCHTITHATTVAGHTATQALNGDFTVVAHGWVRYTDVFGQKRETRFRFFTNAVARNGGMPIAATPTGNSMT